jgi:hypothetical protein
MILLLLLLYIVMVILMGNHIKGILLSRLAIIVLALTVILHEHSFYSLACQRRSNWCYGGTCISYGAVGMALFIISC